MESDIKYVETGMTAKQFVELLTYWTDEIDKKIITLGRGARIYTILNYLGVVSVALLTISLLSLESALTLNSQYNNSSKLIISIIIFVFQLLLAFFNASMNTIQPNTKANNCSICSKQYSELSRELEVIINKISNNIDNDEIVTEYSTNALYYSSREQIILLSEPQLVFIGHKRGSLLKPKNEKIKQKIRLSRNKFKQSIKNNDNDIELQEILGKYCKKRNKTNETQFDYPV